MRHTVRVLGHDGILHWGRDRMFGDQMTIREFNDLLRCTAPDCLLVVEQGRYLPDRVSVAVLLGIS